MDPKINYKKYISIVILILTFSLLFYYLNKNLDTFSSLRLISPLLIFALVIFSLINYLLLSIISKNLLSALLVKITLFESFSLSIMTGFYNLITPFRGGMFARAYYLKRNHDFAIKDFFAILSATYIISFLVTSIIGMFSTVLIYLTTGIFSSIIFILFFSTFFALSIIVIFSPRFPLTKYNYINNFIGVANGWHLIKDNKNIIFTTSILSIIFNIINAIMLFLSFQVFGLDISFASSLFLVSISSYTILVNITPAGLGITEAIAIFSGLTIGITPEMSLPPLLLQRAVSFIILLSIGPIFSYLIYKRDKRDKKQS